MSSPVNDLKRWQENALLTPTWEERNRLIGTWIASGSSVIDVGAGSRNLLNYLVDPRSYVAVDIIQEHPGTLYADFNSFIAPQITGRHDYVVCSGLLEYIVNLDFLLDQVARWGRFIIVTYACREHVSDEAVRIARGWVNNLSKRELLALLRRNHLFMVQETVWNSTGGNQDIFMLKGRASLGACPGRSSTPPVPGEIS